MRKNRFALFAALAAAAVALASCASAPAAAKAPVWTLQTPAPDAKYTYFVGYSDAGPGQAAQATDAATASLIAEIMRYIGVTITAESSATAKATLDSFQSDIIQTVKQSSTSRVVGFQATEKFQAVRKDGLTVYILGRYETAALEAERKRIAALFQEKIDAVARPEAEAKELLASGDAVGAVRKFIEAAAAASGTDIENAAIKFERNLSAAKNVVAGFAFERLNNNLRAAPGEPFSEPFKVLVKSGGRPVSAVPVTVSYQAKLPNGRMTTRNVPQSSGSDGVVSFAHPVPDFVGGAKLTVRLDLSSASERLFDIPDRFRAQVASLEDEIAAKRVTFDYSVVSAARSVPLAVLVVDLDASGSAVSASTSAALVSTLASNGFNVAPAALSADAVAGKDDRAVLDAARAALGSSAKRFAYGTTRVASVRDDRGQKIVAVSATVKVVELETGRVLYSAAKQASAVAQDAEQAAESARRQLGQKTIGEDLAASLP